MTEDKQKFEETYGTPRSAQGTSRSKPGNASPPPKEALQDPLKIWGRRVLGILSVLLVIVGLFFGLAIFLIIGVVFVIATTLSSLLFSGPSSRALTKK